MACNNNGMTYVNTCIPVPGGTATDTTYVVDLTHYTCGNRKICANGSFPVSANLNYRVLGTPKSVGNGTFQCDVLITGSVTYMPYVNGQNRCGCGCNVCPITENVWAMVSIPVTSADGIDVAGGGETIAQPTNLRDCCSITNAVSIVDSFNVATKGAAAADPSVEATRAVKK